MTILSAGQNVGLEDAELLQVTIQCASAPSALDVSCFMINDSGRVPSDAYFVFYNQTADPLGAVTLRTIENLKCRFEIDTRKLRQSAVDKCVFAATLEAGTFTQVSECRAIVQAGSQQITYDIAQTTQETALIFIEVYKYREGFKVRAIGRGFFGGLKPLAESFGIEVDEEAAAQTAASQEPGEPAASAAAAPVAPSPAPAPLKLSKIDLLKRKVALTLEKSKIDPIKARVAVVFDASGSMYPLYRKGIVQEAFERILALAAAFDDDGELDVWFFASEFLRAPSVTALDYKDYISRTYKLGSKGGTNNEPPVIKDIIRKYTVEQPNAHIPTYIIFFSDGGVAQKGKITRLITECSSKNLFWQFVGLGQANYGVLQQLDEMRGRTIDNASFFALDDISAISDEELYERLLNEFPSWIKEARRHGILI
ncbi:vWA domain-containing protein [Cohnella fermenti]|uniref:Tellurium resistance protein TerF n=1 Tax=Cohnella fermenti TaxID=2565925 RepID=A0A4S4BZW1_9BACL|nr:VWA domain-containing protein [Cohnella fermenti]THF78760.1 tellurium resistance protein TerF [Cohnella fermenti]